MALMLMGRVSRTRLDEYNEIIRVYLGELEKGFMENDAMVKVVPFYVAFMMGDLTQAINYAKFLKLVEDDSHMDTLIQLN